VWSRVVFGCAILFFCDPLQSSPRQKKTREKIKIYMTKYTPKKSWVTLIFSFIHWTKKSYVTWNKHICVIKCFPHILDTIYKKIKVTQLFFAVYFVMYIFIFSLVFFCLGLDWSGSQKKSIAQPKTTRDHTYWRVWLCLFWYSKLRLFFNVVFVSCFFFYVSSVERIRFLFFC
jgi:hypothetical protein